MNWFWLNESVLHYLILKTMWFFVITSILIRSIYYSDPLFYNLLAWFIHWGYKHTGFIMFHFIRRRFRQVSWLAALNTIRGWFRGRPPKNQKDFVLKALRKDTFIYGKCRSFLCLSIAKSVLQFLVTGILFLFCFLFPWRFAESALLKEVVF